QGHGRHRGLDLGALHFGNIGHRAGAQGAVFGEAAGNAGAGAVDEHIDQAGEHDNGEADIGQQVGIRDIENGTQGNGPDNLHILDGSDLAGGRIAGGGDDQQVANADEAATDGQQDRKSGVEG